MEKLLVYDSEQTAFSMNEIEDFFAKCGHVSATRSHDIVAAIEGDYYTDEGSATIRLISSKEMLAIEGDMSAVLAAVLEFAAGSTRTLHVIDQAYSFDLPIKAADTSDELMKRIQTAVNP